MAPHAPQAHTSCAQSHGLCEPFWHHILPKPSEKVMCCVLENHRFSETGSFRTPDSGAQVKKDMAIYRWPRLAFLEMQC